MVTLLNIWRLGVRELGEQLSAGRLTDPIPTIGSNIRDSEYETGAFYCLQFLHLTSHALLILPKQ